MNLSTEFVVAAVIQALQHDVLPALDAKSPPAGNLRACIMLLTSIEDRVKVEGRALFDANRGLRDSLERLSAHASIAREAELSDSIASVLRTFPPRDAFVGVADLTRENQAYQEIVVRLVARAHAKRTAWGAEAYGQIRREIESCLEVVGTLDEAFIQHARDLTPI